jgi:hypothetical protein
MLSFNADRPRASTFPTWWDMMPLLPPNMNRGRGRNPPRQNFWQGIYHLAAQEMTRALLPGSRRSRVLAARTISVPA